VVADARIVGGERELAEAEEGSQVDERARRGRDRDAAPAGALGGMEPRPASAAALRRREHPGKRRLALEKPEQVRRRAAAEHGARAAGEDRGHVVGLDARGAVADAIDAAVLRDQRSVRQARGDLVTGQSGSQEL
jgi:hypothetical protein